MSKWNIKSYNRFLSAVRVSNKGMSISVARATYRNLRDSLGRNVFSADVKRHPKETRKAIRDVSKQQKQERRERIAEQKFEKRQARSMEEWDEEMRDAEDFDYYEVESSADYGGKGKK